MSVNSKNCLNKVTENKPRQSLTEGEVFELGDGGGVRRKKMEALRQREDRGNPGGWIPVGSVQKSLGPEGAPRPRCDRRQHRGGFTACDRHRRSQTL